MYTITGSSNHYRRDFDRPNTFAVRFSLVQFGSLLFNMASVDMINFENKYDYPIITNYRASVKQRGSIAVGYKKCITTASSTVLLGITRATRHKFGAIPT